MIIEIPDCQNPKVPKPEKKFHHKIDIQPRFNDFDMFGHVNNTAYLQYLDVAKWSFFEAVIGHPVDVKGLAAVIVNLNTSFYSPTYFHEKLEVTTACLKISEHSFTLTQRVYNPETGDVKCICTSVLAAFDVDTAQGTTLSAEWSKALSRY